MSTAFSPIDINARYRLEAEVGHGAMGSVYRGLDLLLQREVAIKVLHPAGPNPNGSPPSPAGSGGDGARAGRSLLLNEAQSAARLNHPNIVAVYDVGEADFSLPGQPPGRRPYLVMQYVEGRQLSDLLDAKDGAAAAPLPTRQAVEITRQLCAALEAAHAAGIVHRDLKPENVLISPDGAARLTDFGLASWQRPGRLGSRDREAIATGQPGDDADLSDSGSIVGSVFYMAPELALGRPYDHRADLYSLGVMLYEMLAGRLPFEAAPNAPHDPIPVIAQHLHTPPTPPAAYNPAIPPALEALILRLLSKDPAERPSGAAEVAAALDRFLAPPAAALAAGVPAAGVPAAGVPAAFDTPPDVTISPIERLARGRIVGRLHALQEVGRAWARTVAGQGSLLLLSGEPGIGKTRLVRELAVRAEVSGGRALTGVCYPQAEAPLEPILELARALDLKTSGLDEIAGGRLVNAESLYTTLAETFTAAARRTPLLLIIEDAHWADSATLAFVRRLARLAPGLRLLVVLTYREIELSESRLLTDLLTDLNRERLAARVKLARLSHDETGELLAVMFAFDRETIAAARPERRQAFDAFVDRIYEETEGNPFFIEEVVKALIEDGQIVFEHGRWQAANLSDLRIPQSVRLAVQARVERLPEPAREALRLASIFGRRFEFDALLELSGLDEDTLADALDAAERVQLITPAKSTPGAEARLPNSPVFSFTHALIPAALHDDLGRLRRQRLHRFAGLALEKLYPQQTDKLACRLSRHFLEAGDSERAARYLAEVGDQAYAVFAYAEAIESYEQVVEFLRETGRFDKASRYLMKLGLLYHNIFDFARSQQAYAEAFDLYQRAASEPAAPAAEPPPPATRPLRVQWSEPITLDPTLAGDSASIEVIHLLFKGLMELTPDMNIKPMVAQRWEILDGGRRYIFHLRRDWLWSDGVRVTAHDFEFSWKRMLTPRRSSPLAAMFYGVHGAQQFHAASGRIGDLNVDDLNRIDVGIRAVDDYTLLVEMDEPLGYFLHMLAANALPVPRHAVEKFGRFWATTKKLVCNGPFVPAEWKHAQTLRLRRNPNYAGPFQSNLQELELFIDHRDKAALERYERNELDVTSAPAVDYDRVRFQYAAEMVVMPRLLTTYLGFNSAAGPLADTRVRQALVMALDRVALNGKALHGRYAFTNGGFVPPGMPGHSANIGLPFDPAAARQLLAEAGYPGGQGLPEIEFRVIDHVTPHIGAEFVQQSWLDNLGVRLRLTPVKTLEEVQQSRGVWSTGWSADYADPDSFLRMMVFSYPQIAIANPEYTILVEVARTSVDQAERMRLYQRADQILVGDAYVAPLSYGLGHLLIKPWVQGFRPHPLRELNVKDIILSE